MSPLIASSIKELQLAAAPNTDKKSCSLRVTHRASGAWLAAAEGALARLQHSSWLQRQQFAQA